MPNRPAISAEVQREVLIEAGHRCAVCGEPLPLERAHVIPWSRSHDHTAENLICLCANCHARADKENWGEKTLREYKANPWITRRYREKYASMHEVFMPKNNRNASHIQPHFTPVEVHSTCGVTAVTVGERPLVRRAVDGPVDLEFELTNPNREELSIREINVEVLNYEKAYLLRTIPYAGIGRTRRHTCTVKPTVGHAFRCIPTDNEHDFIKLANNELERFRLTVDATCGGLYRLAVTLSYSVGGKVAELRIDGITHIVFLGPTSSIIDGIAYLRMALDDPETANHRAAALELCEYIDCEQQYRLGYRHSCVSFNSDPSLPKLIPILISALGDLNKSVRCDSARFLRRIGDGAAIPALVEALRASVVDDYTATEALGSIGKSALPIISSLLGDSSASRRCSLIRAMAGVGVDAISELKKAIFDQDQLVRKTVAESLGKIGNDAAVEVLVSLLKDPEDSVRSTALAQLGYTRNPLASYALRVALEEGNSQAAQALGNLKPPDIEGLTAALSSVETSVRLASTKALGSLRHIYPLHRNAGTFEQALSGLQKATLASLRQALTDEAPCVRKASVEGLAEIGSTAISELSSALCNEDAVVGKRAAETLGKMGVAAIPALINNRLLAPIETQKTIIWVLYKLGQPAIDTLRTLEQNKDSSMPREAVTALEKIVALEKSIAAMQDSIRQAPKIARIPCKRCSALILPTTANITGGLCMPCYKRKSGDTEMIRNF
ncbi:MAG: hypothetical protein HGB11_07650 [Chlorobiales bacterium]|nr:hypothetical protein [Chlorobiales bacterium]